MGDYTTRRRMMVDTQVRPSDVTKFPIIDAMLTVPREQFVPARRRETAYVGEHIELGDRRVVLEPRALAKTLDAVDLQPSEMVLDVGAGFGYGAAVMARLAEAVIALEDSEEYVSEAETALADLAVDNVVLVNAPLTEGAEKHGPYDAIIIEGAVEEVPAALTDQLKDGGRIAALFMTGALGVCRIGYKMDGGITWRDVFNAAAPVLPGFEKQTAFVL